MAAQIPPAEPVPSVLPPPAGQPRRMPALMVVLAVAIIVVVALVGYALLRVLSTPPTTNVPPHVVAVLSEGFTFLDVPLMTFYTAPQVPLKGFHTNMSYSFASQSRGPSANFTFEWQNARGIIEPVRFVIESTDTNSSFQPTASGFPDGFVYLPAGVCRAPCIREGWELGMSGVGIQYLESELWLMNYTVARMSATTASVEQTWIQVNYSLVRLGGFGDSLPRSNVTVPTSSDLVPVGGVETIGYSKGGEWYELASAGSSTPSNMSFRHTLPPVVFNLGTAGNLAVDLTSEFRWNAASGYWLGWGFGPENGSGTISRQYYLDARFGGLLVQFLP